MKALLSTAVIIISVLLPVQAEERPTILITPIINRTEEAQYDAIGSTVEETLIQSLRLTGRYRVNILQEEHYGQMDTGRLRMYAREHFYDNVLTGEMHLDEQNRIVFHLVLYTAESGTVTADIKTTAENILSVFDASDKLILKLLNSFGDRQWGFGSLTFYNSGFSDSYTVFLNGISLGDSPERADRILTGVYEIEVRQLRFEGEKVIYSGQIEVRELTDREVHFRIPDLLPEEQQRLNNSYDSLVRHYREEEKAFESAEVLRILSYLDAFPFHSEKLQFERRRFSKMRDRWLLYKEWWAMEEDAPAAGFSTIENSITIFRNHQDIDELKKLALLNGRLLSALLSMQAVNAFTEENLAEGRRLYETILAVANAFGSPSGFGYADEYRQIQEILQNERWGDRRKRRKIIRILSERQKISADFLKNSQHHKLLVLSDFSGEKTRINRGRERIPYYEENYRGKRVKIDGREINTFGSATIYYIPDWNLDKNALSGNQERLDYDPFQSFAGTGIGSWISLGFQWRFAGGDLALRPSVELSEGGVTLPVELDYFWYERDNFEIYSGILTDSFSIAKETASFSSFGLNFGCVMDMRRISIFIDNRIFFYTNPDAPVSREILYAPHLGILF